MRTPGSKTIVRIATASLWLLCAGMFVWAFAARVSIPDPTPRDTKSAAPKLGPNAQPGPAAVVADRWESLFARRFQRPLFDPPVEAPPPVVEPVTPPPPIQLVATMPESGGGSVMVRDDKGVTSTVAVGASITAGGTSAKLLNVYDDRIELEHMGKVITVMLNTNKKE